MNFLFSEEQEEFRRMVRRFVDERWSIETVRHLSETDSGYDEGVWKQATSELGLAGLAIPEQYGGAGFGFLELGIALEELGKHLAGGPLFATACLGATAILNGGNQDDCARWLPSIAAGECIATLAVGEGVAEVDAASVSAVCRSSEEGWTVSGAKSFVVDGQNADILVVAAREEGSSGDLGVSLLIVAADAPGVEIKTLQGLDVTRRLADIAFSDAPAVMLGKAGEAGPALTRTLREAAVGITADQVGATAWCLQDSLQYAEERIQFGRRIGSFQALKHRCAETKLALELARSAAYWSWWVVAEDPSQLDEASAVAKSMCSDAFRRAAADNIHIHGGMGFTWEHDGHFYYRRAKADEVLFGNGDSHRARLADHLGFPL